MRIVLPDSVNAYDLQVAYDSEQFSPSIVHYSEKISIFKENKELGLLSIISENKNSNNIVLGYELKGKKTKIDLFVQAYSKNGKIISNMQRSIEIHSIPEQFTLSQNYPNPFNPSTEIEYGLPKISSVQLSIYDILGRNVITLVDGIQDPGYKIIQWNGRDNMGKKMGAGMYFYSLKVGSVIKTRKMIFLK